MINKIINNVEAFIVESGIYKSKAKKKSDYVELSDDELKTLNKEAANKGWKKAVKDNIEGNNRFSAAYALDNMRADFMSAAPSLNEKKLALDIGSGMGGILTHLATMFETVVANELSHGRIEFSKIRLDEEEKKNVVYINSSYNDIEFKENIFDFIVLNGVLEWVPISYDLSTKPRDAQKDFLLRISKTMKKDAVLYIGIENRFSKEALTGHPDPHTGVRFHSIVPRFIADIMSKILFKQDNNRLARMDTQEQKYRTYTYTAKGYKKLLEDLGYRDVLIYPVFPSYNKPRYIFSDDLNLCRKNVQYATNNSLLRIIYRINPRLIKCFAPSFCIFARK